MRSEPALVKVSPAPMSAPASKILHHVLLALKSVTGVRQEKKNRSCFAEEVQEQPLDEPGSPGGVGRGSAVSAGTKKRVLMGDLRRPRRWHLPVLAVSTAINVVLLVCIAVGAVSRRSNPQTAGAATLGCRDGWIGYRGICYYVSREEASWESSQRHCSSLGASLAVLKREWEVRFLRELKSSTDCWLGLRRQDGRLVWVDGTVYNETFPVHGQGACAYMNDAIASSSCSQLRPYICSVALAPL
ncbi:C-type lectin domain family 2 member D-like isoform X3 [Apteryx rowi]|uniref:C-type lectin domain family 2 member D-like isoform X3 n=1 Tax=Apteryx rowi TaxID=308060 RepID=UPI000E1C78AE|nr:C-type lectin domain family 2 member D-like isoform X3 [Apteryx rowi]